MALWEHETIERVKWFVDNGVCFCNHRGMNYIYRLFDADDKLLYIGLSMCPLTRMERHQDATKWIAKVRLIKLEPVGTNKPKALSFERKYISEERPKYNVHHNEFKWLTESVSMQYLRYLEGHEKKRARMVILRGQGWSFQRIGDKFGISRQRVQQICKPKASPNGK